MSAQLAPRIEEGFGTTRALDGQCGAIRRRFFERLDESLGEARAGGHRAAVLLVGLDRSSSILGSLEPEAGELLLARAGERLAGCTGEGGVAAQLRADRFALLLPRFRSGSQVRDLASRMLGLLRFPFRASIGIAVFPGDGADPPALIGCAAMALAHARHEGKHSYCFYLRAFATSAASSAPVM